MPGVNRLAGGVVKHISTLPGVRAGGSFGAWSIYGISLDHAKSNFTSGLDYAKRKNLLWHPSGDYYPYPSAAWRLGAVPDPDAFNENLSFAPTALFEPMVHRFFRKPKGHV